MPKASFEAMLLGRGSKAEGHVPDEWEAIDNFDKFHAKFFGYRDADDMVHASTLNSVSQPASQSLPHTWDVTHMTHMTHMTSKSQQQDRAVVLLTLRVSHAEKKGGGGNAEELGQSPNHGALRT